MSNVELQKTNAPTTSNGAKPQVYETKAKEKMFNNYLTIFFSITNRSD